MQSEIEFPVHDYENNSESLETLTIKKNEFQGQNRLLYSLLMAGNRISFSDAYITHHISDVRRRSKDLVDKMGVLLSKEFIPGTRSKIYFMTESQIEYNKKFINGK